jgi:23S rRNA pseudouridine2605 synthase
MRGRLALARKKFHLMSNNVEFTAQQLTAARAKAWHQDAEPVLTLEAARDLVTAAGLVLFTPRSAQIPAPAPSFVEATMGAAASDPAPDAISTALTLVARLVAEGTALPVNLLGTIGELPDFIVSAQVFSFLYTLRGDKNWKQPPATTGVTKSSPLGVRIYEVLTEKGALSAAELASELGRELTESAVQRALSELWSNLRVLPLYGQDNTPVLWELATRRFTKAIKAGVNAGQPTALSALISLYLAQALLATEEEIEVFLSPLSARSRIRDVVHALTNSRQLEIVVLDGKSLLHIPGTLPEFPAAVQTEVEAPELAAAEGARFEGEGRIKRFTLAADSGAFGDFKGKPVKKVGTGFSRPAPRSDARPDAERRPFKRSADSKPSFTKPWSEDRKPRAPRTDGEAPRRAFKPRAEGEGFAPKRPYTPRTEGAGFAKRPYAPRAEGEGFAPKRPYTPRAEGTGFAKRPYTPRDGASSDRPARPSFGAKRTFGDKPAYRKSGDEADRKPRFAPKDGERKTFERKPFAPREGGSARPSFGAKRTFDDKPAGDRPFRKFDAPKRPFTPREERGGRADKPAYGGSDSKPRAAREEREYTAPAGAPKRPFPRKPGDLADRPVRVWATAAPKTGRDDGRKGGYGSKPHAPRSDSGDRPSRPAFGAKRTFGDRAFGDRPKTPFKSAGGNRARTPASGFAKRPPAGDKVPFGSKPPRGVNPRTASRTGYKRKPASEE